MKVTSKNTPANGTNRVSALKRLSKPTSNVHQRLSASTTPTVTDARQLLSNRNKPVFDARQLLSRQSSKTVANSLTIQEDIIETDEDDLEYDIPKTVVLSRSTNGQFISGSTFPTEPISFTKTITNASFQYEDDNRHSSDQKFVINFVNDQCRKRPKSPSPSPPPVIRRLHDASIQTHKSSTTRSPIQTHSHRRHLDDHEDYYEPPTKRNSSRSDREQQGSLKRTSTGASASTQSKKPSSNTTVLITNLQSSVTEDDVIELFSEVGHIIEIKTLSRGCVQIIYSKQEHAEQAVEKYHNRLLDGQLMYVSLQQPSSYTTKSSQNFKSTTKKETSSSSNNHNEPLKSTSKKLTIDPSFIRQALFNPSSNTANPVQFQVKL